MTGSRGWICPVVADAARLIIFLYFAGLSCATAMQRFDAHSKRRLIPEVELYPIFQTRFASAMLPPGTSSRRNEVCSTLLADDFSEWNPSASRRTSRAVTD